MFGRRSFPNAFTRLASSFDSPSHRPWGGHGSLRDQLAPVAGKPSGKPREIYGKFTVNLREISGKLPGDPMDYPSDPLYTSNHKMVSSLKGYVLKITEKPYPGRPFRNILDAETIYGKFTVTLR